MFVLMIYSNLFHYFVTGPFMKPVLFDADTCEDTWWWNLLYLNNFGLKAFFPASIAHDKLFIALFRFILS